MLREIFKSISIKNSPYNNIYYLTDTELTFTINDDRIARKITISIRNEDNHYIAYGFETSQIEGLNNNVRHRRNEVLNIEHFWKWYSNFYNDLS